MLLLNKPAKSAANGYLLIGKARPKMFDFDRDWDLCLPHLKDRWVLRELDKGMEVAARVEGRGPWDREKGPWQYGPTGRLCSAPLEILEKREPDWKERHRHLWPDPNGAPTEEWKKAFDEAIARSEPRPDMYEWYQTWNVGYGVCRWAAALGTRVYPQLTWCTYVGANWATAIGFDRGVPEMVFDVECFDHLTGRQTIKFVEKKRDDWVAPELRPILACRSESDLVH